MSEATLALQSAAQIANLRNGEVLYTCNWCNTIFSANEIETPPEWLTCNIHDPAKSIEATGFFCKEYCQTTYLENEPHAVAVARKKYVDEFYIYLNLKKGEAR